MPNQMLIENLVDSGTQIAIAIPGIQVLQPTGPTSTLIQTDGLDYNVFAIYANVIAAIQAVNGLANQVLQTTLIDSGSAIGFAVPGIKAVTPYGLSTTQSVIQAGGKDYPVNTSYVAVIAFINAVP